ncbi:MAG: DUF2079 domain-containing protein [Chloroflexota bacterium]|nr:DUF2079 domain-containing protein [Chloroflexota bacterium]
MGDRDVWYRASLARLMTAVCDLLDSVVPCLLGAAILVYITVIFLVSKWQLDTLRMGFDPLVYVQPLWNTLHGRVAAQSMFAYRSTIFGQDLFLFHFVLLPFYALHPTIATLLLLQTIAAGAGAVAIFLIARDALPDHRIVALLFALLFLSYLPLQNDNLYEVQPRLFAATFFLFAYWCMTRGYTAAFWALILLAISNRTDAALIVAMLGCYGLLTHRSFAFSWLPLGIGGGYWVLATLVIIPAFAGGRQFLYLENYGWLGDNLGAIVRTITTHPLFVFRAVFARDWWDYPIGLLFALAFLPLLQPRALIIAAPSFLLNFFAGAPFADQRDIFHQYSAFITPWLFVAVILAVAALAQGTHPIMRAFPRLRAIVKRRDQGRVAISLVLLMLALSVLQQGYTRPNKIGDFLHHSENVPRVTAVDSLIPLIPPDAPLAVTSLAATRVPLRRALYAFPGNASYDPALVDCAVYLLGDRQRDAATEGNKLDSLVASGEWRLVAQQGDFELLQHTAPSQSEICRER